MIRAARAWVCAAGALAWFHASPARAHEEPIPPSSCVPRLTLGGAHGQVEAEALVGPADETRIKYVNGSDLVQFEIGGAGAGWSFTLGGTSGTVRLPADFQAALSGRGDLATSDLPFSFDVGGATTTGRAALTTGLAAMADGHGNVVVEGTPMAADGAFVLAGVIAPAPSLGAPMDDALVVRFACRTQPVPDFDQFPEPPRVTLRSGRIAAGALRLSFRVWPAGGSTFDPARPAVVRVGVGDAAVAEAVLLAGLTPGRGRRFAGGPFAVRVKGRKRGAPFDLAIQLPAPAMTFPAAGPAEVSVSLDVAGIAGRARARFRSVAGGRTLRFR